jgi:hypothetical protein
LGVSAGFFTAPRHFYVLGVRLQRLSKEAGREAALAAALALASACGPRRASVYAWRGAPDAVIAQRDVELDSLSPGELAGLFRRGAEGIVLGVEDCPIGAVEVEAYASPSVPVEAAVVSVPLDVLAEPLEFGDFYALAEERPGELRRWLDAAFAEMEKRRVAGRRGLLDAVLWVKASRDWGFSPGAPLWYGLRGLAQELYAAAPPDYRRLLGLAGAMAVIRRAGVLDFLRRCCGAEAAGRGLRLRPAGLPAAEAALRRLLEAFREAVVEAAPHAAAGWSAYVEAAAEALKKRLPQP